MRFALFLLLAACVAACAEPTTTGSAAPAAAGSLRLEEVGTIGCASCARTEQLSVFAMSLGADGLIWTIDRYPPHMRVFGLDG